jgi:lipopolysaccharide export system protein LptA
MTIEFLMRALQRSFLSLCVFMVFSHVYGLSSDFEQPIEIEADYAELDEEKGETVYIGNVVVVQGSIIMTGDRLTANFTSERELEDAVLEGRLATFKQTPESGEKDIEGEAEIVEMQAFENIFYLTGKAKVTQGKRLTQGHHISYDTERGLATVRGAGPRGNFEGKLESKERGRVRIIIPPKEDDNLSSVKDE